MKGAETQFQNLDHYSSAQIKGPKIRDVKSISQNRFIILILLTVGIGLINYITIDSDVQIDFNNYAIDTEESAINFSMVDMLSNIPNCVITPLIFGYTSDFISIGYLLNFTSIIMLLSSIMLYGFFTLGYSQLYIISRVFFFIANEGQQNSIFNLIYEYSNMNKTESCYFAIHTVLGYNIPRILPYIYFLIYDYVKDARETIIEHKYIYFSQYLAFNVIACILMGLVTHQNKKKEQNEEELDITFFCARIAPQQKFNFFQAVKYMIVTNKYFSIQCLLGGILVGFTCIYFQTDALIRSMLKVVNTELILDIDFSTKGFTQISSILFIYLIAKRMDNTAKKIKFYLLWYCMIGLAVLCCLLNFIFLIENKIAINIIVYTFLFFIGLQYYCSFMAINSIIYQYSGWFQRGMGYGLFSCLSNTFITIGRFINYNLAYDYPVQICIILVVLVIILIIVYDFLQISKARLNYDKLLSPSQPIKK